MGGGMGGGMGGMGGGMGMMSVPVEPQTRGRRQPPSAKKKQLRQIEAESIAGQRWDQAGAKPAGPVSVSQSPDDGGPTVRSKRSGKDPQGTMVLPAPRGVNKTDLIPIVSGSASIARPQGSTDPYKYWSDYFRKHDENAVQLRETVRLLNSNGKFREVHAALIGYLTQRPKNREPWMYLAPGACNRGDEGQAR